MGALTANSFPSGAPVASKRRPYICGRKAGGGELSQTTVKFPSPSAVTEPATWEPAVEALTWKSARKGSGRRNARARAAATTPRPPGGDVRAAADLVSIELIATSDRGFASCVAATPERQPRFY
jgi:hypothetical protein